MKLNKIAEAKKAIRTVRKKLPEIFPDLGCGYFSVGGFVYASNVDGVTMRDESSYTPSIHTKEHLFGIKTSNAIDPANPVNKWGYRGVAGKGGKTTNAAIIQNDNKPCVTDAEVSK